jgi:PDZ domain
MAPPRHLWSGDWRRESDAVANDLARRRALGQEPSEPEPEAAPPPPPPQPSLGERLAAVWAAARARVGGLRRVRPDHARLALLAAVGALVVAGAAYGLASLGGSSGSDAAPTPGGSNGSHFSGTSSGSAWLGVQVAMPVGGGVIVDNVVPGGPADRAGLEPGDVLMQIGNEPITTPADVSAALGGLHPGDQVQITALRGASTYTTEATLTGRRPKTP